MFDKRAVRARIWPKSPYHQKARQHACRDPGIIAGEIETDLF